MAYDIITVNPTLSTATTQAGDVLFLSTAVKLPSRACKLFNMQCIFDDTQPQTDKYNIFFFQENTNDLGPINEDTDITAAEISENVLLGVRKLLHDSEYDNHLGVPTLMISEGSMGDTPGEYMGPFEDLILKSGTTKDTIYMQGVIEVSGSMDFAADAMVITLHVEY